MKIELPIDTSAVSFIDVMPPEPVLDHKTKQQRSDANGEPLYSIELLVIGEEGGEVLPVKFAGTAPAGIRQGLPVKVTGLMVTDWSIGDRFGLTFRAAKVEPGAAPGQKAGAA
jgi:hypothetical protein